jgi:glutamine amidotransferase
MGWNTLRWDRPDPLLEGLPQDCSVYFVHSYRAAPTEPADAPVTCAATFHGRSVCASVWRGPVRGTQFHPEKSQRVGLKMLENFAAL